MRYAVRDPETGKFAKTERINWREVKIMTTIDNETHADVTQDVKETVTENQDLPAMLRDDETTIRSTFQKFVDGVVSLSSYARQVDMLVAQMETLKKTIEEANARVIQANEARDAAIAEATEAKASAKMAREAYNVVDAAHIAATSKLAMYSAEIDELKQSETLLQNKLALEEEAHRLTNQLYTRALEERDSFREESGSFRNKWEDEVLKNMEFEDTKETLATTQEALSICATNVSLAREAAKNANDRADGLDQECKGLHHKVNALEDRVKEQGETIITLQTKIANAATHLH